MGRLLDRFSRELRSGPGIADLFSGLLVRTTQCAKCHAVSESPREPFTSLPINVLRSNVQDALDGQLLSKEILRKNEDYYCKR